MNGKSGIGYGVYCPSRDTFLGKLGEWYTDVRLAAVYAEPRAAKMAIGRLDHRWPCQVVPIVLTVRGIDLEPLEEKVEPTAETTTKRTAEDRKANGPPTPAKTPAKAA